MELLLEKDRDSPLSSSVAFQEDVCVSITFNPPALHFQALHSSKLSTGHLHLCHPGSPLAWRVHDLLLCPASSPTPTSSHKFMSKAHVVPSSLLPCISSAESLVPTKVCRRCQFVNIPGLKQFIFINSLDKYVISPRLAELYHKLQ